MEPIIKTDIEARVKDTGDTMTGTLYIDAELGLITGSETQTSYSGVQATRLCTADDNNINTAGFIINSTGESKFLHRRGNRSASEDAYFQFDGTGFSFFANGTKGGTPVNATPVFQALQNASNPTFNGINLSLEGHNHTALTNITELWWKCHENDFAAIKTTIQDTNTYFDFYLGDDPGQYDTWRWRFKPSGADEVTSMMLDPVSNTGARLYIYGGALEISGASVDTGYLSNSPYIYVHSNTYGGSVFLGADKEGGYLQLNKNDGTIGCHLDVLGDYPRFVVYNSSGSVIYNQYINNYALNSQVLKLTGGTMTGDITFATIATWPTESTETYPIESKGISWSGSSDGAKIFYRVSASDTGNLVLRTLDDANCNIIFENSSKGELGKITSNGIYGAVWNDYAEYRAYQEEKIPYGRCVIEVGNDSMRLAKQRLELGAAICSDTFGFAIGETKECQMPIAVSGRVLAYPLEGREVFAKNIGKPVCSGPNGTVSLMSDEEYKEKGYCCIGTISAIPEYEIWGSGEIKVDGRVWIQIK